MTDTMGGNGGCIPTTHTQHCFLVLGPPNLGLSRQLTQEPQSCTRKQPRQCPHRAILIFLPWWEGSGRRGVGARGPPDPAGSESPPGPADSTFPCCDRDGTLSVSDADDVSRAAQRREWSHKATRPSTSSPCSLRDLIQLALWPPLSYSSQVPHAPKLTLSKA